MSALTADQLKAGLNRTLRSSGTSTALQASIHALLIDHIESFRPIVPPILSGIVKDDDSAASNGTALFISPEANGVTAGLYSTTLGNAGVPYRVGGSGGPNIFVNDDDSPPGVQVYFDEGATADQRFMCVSPTGSDIFIIAVDGSTVRVVHNDDAATDGVAVHIDDDAANPWERLLFVSPTDTDGTFSTDDILSFKL